MNSSDLRYSRTPICEKARPEGVRSGIPSLSSSAAAVGIVGIDPESPVLADVEDVEEGYFAGSRGGRDPLAAGLSTSILCAAFGAVLGFVSSRGVGVILLMCCSRIQAES